LPQLRANTGNGTNARIMNTGSMAGVAPRLGGGLGAYSASKAAVVVYSEILREELAPEGIGVSVLCPGTVISGIWEAERNRPEQLGEGHRVPPPDRSAQAMPASQVAATVLAGIEANEAFIFTHADSRGRIEERFERIAGSLDALDAALATSEAGGTT
jgi:short-subunit dehydrogenase